MPRRKLSSTTGVRLKRFFRRLRIWRPSSQADLTGDSSNRLKVHVFNVGQGDHILLEFPNGDYGIIDFYFEGSIGLREPPALTYLRNVKRLNPNGQITIAFICISHPDFDHVKGADTFLKWAQDNQVKIDNFWLPAGKEFPKIYDLYKIAFAKHAKDRVQRDEGIDLKDRLRVIRDYLGSKDWAGHTDDLQGAIRSLDSDLGGGVEVVLIAPLTRHVAKFDEQVWRDFFRFIITKKRGNSAQTNLMSSILLLILNNHRLLFGGDTGLDVWLECLNEFDQKHQKKYFGRCTANFVKVSHHGSENSSSADLWRRILGKDVKIAISAGKTYGHPHPNTLRDIARAAREIGSRIQILSTNTCTNCLVNQSILQEPLNKLAYDPPRYPAEVTQTLNRIRGISKEVSSRITLGSYIFRFPVDGDDITVTKGVHPDVGRDVTCVYHNPLNRPFPNCAL